MAQTFNFLKRNYILIGILMLAAALRFYHLDFQSLWLDETLTMKDANPKLTLTQFYDGVMFWEFMPHLYYFLTRIIFEIFGFSTVVARAFSAVIGIFGVYAIYLLGKEIFSRKAGLIAALLLAVNIFHISYSQEIRPYGMLFLFSALSFYRLVIFIKKPSVRNAVFYGIFTGLIVNSHFFGVLTILSQCIILLYFLVIIPKENRLVFLKYSLIGGGVALLVFLPAIQPFVQVSQINSFWLEKPGPDAFTTMFRNFFGSSEMVLFILEFVIIYYVVSLFKQKIVHYNYDGIVNNKLILGFVVLFVWLFVSITIPLLRSYLDVPMIISRYFINILAVLILVIAIGIALIKNKVLKIIVVFCLVCFSLIDILAVKKYYSTVTKTQFRELTEAIKENNPDKVKVVAFWSWIFPHYFQEDPEMQIQGSNLEDYVTGMRNGTISQDPFWYADANSRPYTLSAENQAYLDMHFITAKKLEYYDIWANYYIPKSKPRLDEGLKLSTFKPANFDNKGNLLLLENITTKSSLISLEKGNYDLIISGNSVPEKPIKGENAHLIIKYDDIEIANFNLSENKDKSENVFSFNCPSNKNGRIEVTFDNDIFINGQDRNAIIYSIKIVNK